MNTSRLLSFFFLLITLTSPESAFASENLSNPTIVPASTTWTGITSHGYPMSFNVGSNGTKWNTFKLKAYFVATTCPGYPSGTIEPTIPGPGSIVNNQFNVPGSGLSATGEFTSATIATGTYSFSQTIVIPISSPPYTCIYYFNESGTWTASVQTSKLTSRSARTRDGWILESKENGNKGGTMNSVGSSLLLGDNAANKQYRDILHFDTSSILDNAVITKVILRIKKQGLVGTNPFTTHKKIAIDIRKNWFNTSANLQITDFQATPSKSVVGLISNNPKAGNWYTANLKSTAFPYINRTGSTQFRLYFQLDDNNDHGADYLKFYSGDTATASYRPTLIVTYYVP